MLYILLMVERIFSHLNKTVGDKSNSLRTVVPRQVVQKLGLTETDILEWILQSKGDTVVCRKL